MTRIDEAAVEFWEKWWAKWERRITCLSNGRRRLRASRRRPRRTVRDIDVRTAWTRVFMPAMDPAYVVPEEWLALTPEQKRLAPRPTLVLQPQRAHPASERGPGWSMDDVGPYLKLPDGTVFRDRASAAHSLWRHTRRTPELQNVIEYLSKRPGRGARPVRARTPERVRDALVAFGLVHAGMTRIAAARRVLEWAGSASRDPKKVANENTRIWHEFHLPAVRE